MENGQYVFTKYLSFMFLIFFFFGCGVTEQEKCQGRGTIKYADGVYTGECSNGKAEGNGTLIRDDGALIAGEWSNGRVNGQAVAISPDKIRFKGNFVNDKQHGVITITSQYGTVESVWKEGNITKITNQSSHTEAYDYFNKIRVKAGLIPLSQNGILQDTAQNHSDYLELNYKSSFEGDPHTQDSNNEGFTGEKVSDRAISSGYYSRMVKEGLSPNYTAIASIESLMTAIYHRFDILGFDIDEMGVGFTQDEHVLTRIFVHNLGNSKLNQLCQEESKKEDLFYYYNICKELGHKIDEISYLNAFRDIFKQNPKYVVWPPNNSEDNLYKFQEEVPDPMPDYNLTGNPVSIEFNPYYSSEFLMLRSFKIFENDIEIKETRVIDKFSDVNQIFTIYQFALFPLKPLKRGVTYNVVFEYEDNFERKKIEWSFKTQDRFDLEKRLIQE